MATHTLAACPCCPGTTTLFYQSTAPGTCTFSGATMLPLALTVGSGATVEFTNVGSFVTRATWDIPVSATAGQVGTYYVQHSATLTPNIVARWRLEFLDGSCTVLGAGSYGLTYSSSGTYGFSEILTIPSGTTIVRMSHDIQKPGGGNPPAAWQLNDDANSYILLPFL